MISRHATSEFRPDFDHTIVIVVGAALAVIGVAAIAKAAFPSSPLLFSDFTVFWSAARSPNAYDAGALTRAQKWLFPNGSALRPFAYPPSALLLLKPLGLLSFPTATALWTALGASCFAAATATYGRRAFLGLLSPMFALSALLGQASLFLGGALAAAVAELKTRPAVAGALLGLVGVTKPSLAILVLPALIVSRHWRALIAAIAAGAAVIAASLLLGPHLWVEWFKSLPGFLDQVEGRNFRAMNSAPGLIFAPVGILSVWYVWTHTERPDLRLLALVSGTCLCVPYMMEYDLVAMAPAAAMLLVGRDWRGWLVGCCGFIVFWLSPLIVALGTPFLVYRARWNAF